MTMRCIFCKADSTSSRSVEHVIPESLGNTEHTLRPGVVCDGCNNYFAHSVEGPLLSDPYFREKRFRSAIVSKKGKPPKVLGIHLPDPTVVEIISSLNDSGVSIGIANENDEKRWIESLLTSRKGNIIIPKPEAPNEMLMSRFLAKVALECLTLRLVDIEGGLEEVTNKLELDPLRNYARRGNTKQWPFHARSLYPQDLGFSRVDGETYEVLHEWTLLYENQSVLYLIIAIFGIEYAINFGEPEIASYNVWLQNNSDRSPLYPNGFSKYERASRY